MVTTRPPKTIVKPTALGPVANTDTKLLIYGLFQKGRVLAQDGTVCGVIFVSSVKLRWMNSRLGQFEFRYSPSPQARSRRRASSHCLRD